MYGTQFDENAWNESVPGVSLLLNLLLIKDYR